VREVDYGAWEGFPADEIERRWPGMLQAWRADPDVRAPEGESVNDVAERLRSVVGTLMDDGVDRTVVIASHLLPVRAMIGMALDAPPKAWPRIRVTPGSVSIVRFWSDFYAEVVTTGWPVDT
jgi:broad specificity phosphatase PhoE